MPDTQIPVTVQDHLADAKLVSPFGNGRYSKETERLFEESKSVFGFTEEQALKFAKNAASDFGKLMKDVTVKLTVGKPSLDNKATMGEICSRKGVTLTNALTLVRALQWVKEAERNGISYGFTKWSISRMNDNLQEYVANL